MKPHQAQENWRLGLGLALTTVILWGLLPLALSVVSKTLDIYTINSFRFISSFVLMSCYLAIRRQVPTIQQWRSLSPGLLLLATAGLAINYWLFVQGLIATSPSHAEVLIQLAHLFFGCGGLLIFQETYNRQQFIGLFLLILGLVGFFHEQITTTLFSEQYWTGSQSLVLAALAWAVYALAQKQLLQQLTSGQIMWMLYGLCGIGFGIFSHPASLLQLTGWQWGMLVFCGLNTFVAYGAFAESLQHWPASRVSAVLALAPIITLIAMALAGSWLSLHPEKITPWGIAGACIVVTGSISIALGDRH